MDNINEQLTLKQLKENLRDTLKKSGCLSSVKAQIRREFVQSIKANNGLLANASPRQNDKNVFLGDRRPSTLHNRIIYSLIYHYLFKRNMTNTLSVFIAEYGDEIDHKSFLLSELDIIATLQLNSTSKVYQSFVLHDREQRPENTSNNSISACLLDYFIDETFSNIFKCVENSTQTDETGVSALDMIEFHMRDIRKDYNKKREYDLSNHSKTIEERMILFERECEERFRHDLQLQIAHYRETEILKVRLEERQKARTEFESLRNELEEEYNRKLENHRNRENEMNRRAEEKERHFQRTLYDARQQMQKEIDDIRNQEQLISRKLELESQSLHILELRLKESQVALENREKEVVRRELEALEHMKEASKKAKEEAKNNLRSELESLMIERSALIQDRQRFEDEKSYHTALIDSANAVRQQLRELQAQLLIKNDEVSLYKQRLEKIEARRVEEIELKSKPEYSTGIVTLIHRNAELEARLRDRDDHNIVAKNEEVQRLTLTLKELQLDYDTERKNYMKESDSLKRTVEFEKSRADTLQMKCQELEKQVRDYKTIIMKLQMLQKRNSSPPSNASKGKDHTRRISELVEEAIGKSPKKAFPSYRDRSPINTSSHQRKNIDYSKPNDLQSTPFPTVPSQNPFLSPGYLGYGAMGVPLVPPVPQMFPTMQTPFASYYQNMYGNPLSQPGVAALNMQSMNPIVSSVNQVPVQSNEFDGLTTRQPIAVPTVPKEEKARNTKSEIFQNDANLTKEPNELSMQVDDRHYEISLEAPATKKTIDKESLPRLSVSEEPQIPVIKTSSTLQNLSPTPHTSGLPILSPKSIDREQQLRKDIIALEKDRLEKEYLLQLEKNKLEQMKSLSESELKLKLSSVSQDSNIDLNLHSSEKRSYAVSSLMNSKDIRQTLSIDSLEAYNQGVGDISKSNTNLSEGLNKPYHETPMNAVSSPKQSSSPLPRLNDETKQADEKPTMIEQIESIASSKDDKLSMYDTPLTASVSDSTDAKTTAITEEQRRQEEDRRAIIEARQRVLERRNKKMLSSFESTNIASSMDDRPLVASISSLNPSPYRGSDTHLATSDVYSSQSKDKSSNNDENQHSDVEYETKVDESSDSDNGWF